MSEVTHTSENLDPDEKLAKFKKDIADDANVVSEQRDQANEDMRFVNVTGGMWEGFLENDFDADRVKLELDIVSKPLQTFIGEWKQNRRGVDYKPDDKKTSEDDAELMDGIYRGDFRDNSGKLATDLGVYEAATCGYGAFKLATKFEDDENEENDNQRIEWRPIYNAYNSVFWDQGAQRSDKRDARWCTVLKPFTKDSFEEAYPDKTVTSAYTPDDRSFNSANITKPDFIYVAIRYEAVRKKETVFVYNNLSTEEVEVYTKEQHGLIEDELKADEFREFVRERKIMRRSVEKTVFSGADILEKTRRIAGKWIPIIPFYGTRAYVDGVEYYRGLIRKKKDANRVFNMQVSQLAENAASSGQDVPIFDPEQMSNPEIQALWADKNNKPYLLAKALRDADGNVVATGPLAYSKPPQLDASSAALLNIIPAYMQDVSGTMPQEVSDPDASGKAIKEMRKILNMITADLSDNIEQSIQWSGEVYQAMAAEVYTTQRTLSLIGKDGAESQVQLFKSVLDSETGRIVESNSLRGKKFKAFADTGPQYETMREQTVEDLKGMLEAMGTISGGEQYTPVMLAVLLNNISGVGLEPLKKLNREIMLAQGHVEPEGEEEEALVAQLAQPQEDPQKELVEAATNQQNAEARNLDAASIKNIADANKKEAETIEIMTSIETDRDKLDLQVRKQFTDERNETLKTVRALPVG